MSLERPCYRHPNRMTAVSCSDCGRPICPDCMVFAPVGIKCPDHAGGPGVTHPDHRGAARMKRSAVQRPKMVARGGAPLTVILIAVNVLIYLVQLGAGASMSASSGWIFEKGALISRAAYSDGTLTGLAYGDWWRLITSAFLHAGPLHLGLNMLVLWVLGGPLESVLGVRRFAALYLVSGLAGSAGALVWSPNAITVGASGAIYGVMGALLIYEYFQTGRFAGPTLTLIAINLLITFTLSERISVGGHVGGLIAGVLAGFALARFGRGHMAYGRLGIVGIATLVAIGVGSVLIAYYQVGLL